MTAQKNEIVQIVDPTNRIIDSIPRSVMRRDRLIHRASYILVYNIKNELFIQKRTMSKDVYPGYWDIAAGGVVMANESYLQSAIRELHEELGVTNVPLRHLFDNYHEDKSNRVWGRIYTCLHEGPFCLQEEEVEYGRFIAIDQIFPLNETEPFTPDGLVILKKIIASGFDKK